MRMSVSLDGIYITKRARRDSPIATALAPGSCFAFLVGSRVHRRTVWNPADSRDSWDLFPASGNVSDRRANLRLFGASDTL